MLANGETYGWTTVTVGYKYLKWEIKEQDYGKHFQQ